jgi:hypothetical protein
MTTASVCVPMASAMYTTPGRKKARVMVDSRSRWNELTIPAEASAPGGAAQNPAEPLEILVVLGQQHREQAAGRHQADEAA